MDKVEEAVKLLRENLKKGAMNEKDRKEEDDAILLIVSAIRTGEYELVPAES